MSRPRRILPGTFYTLTRRCTQRQFLLAPDETTNNAFLYCLIEAAQRYEIEVLMTMVEADHHHTVIYDRFGRAPRFAEQLHKMFAKCQNARFGRWENLWSSQRGVLTELTDREAVIDALIYVAGNPVKDFLVDSVARWPGANGYRNLMTAEPMRACRPRHFFRKSGKMPAEVEMRLTIPAELGQAEAVIAEVRAGVEALETSTRALRLASGRRVVGRRRLKRLDWRAAPTSREPRRGLRPRYAGKTSARRDALIDERAFQEDYRDARRQWLAGLDVTFPAGTYWLVRFARVRAHPPPAPWPAVTQAS